MRSRDTVKMQGFELLAILVPPLGFSKLLLGASASPKGPPRKGENAPSSLLPSALESQNRTSAYLQWILCPRGLLPRRNAAIRAVARHTVNME